MSSQKFEARKQRINYGIAFTVLLCVEVITAMLIHDKIIRPYVGDILVVIVIYCALRVIIPVEYKLLPMCIFIFAAFIECFQYLRSLLVTKSTSGRLNTKLTMVALVHTVCCSHSSRILLDNSNSESVIPEEVKSLL
ncbi:MAG: DUF2809 domain-containing protein [Clostridiaceae bacterium]